MTFNANDFNAPEVEIVATNTSNDDDEGLEDVTALPFGHDAEEKETGAEIVSPTATATATATGSEFTSDSLDVEQANDDASASSPKAKTMKDVLFRYGYGRGLAVAVVIALAGKEFVARAHNDPPGTDDMIMNADFSKDSSKQVALLDGDGDGKNVANYDFTKVGGSGGMPSERSLQSTSYTFTKVGDGICQDSKGAQFDLIFFNGFSNSIADADACKTKCAQCPGQGQAAGRELRGIYFNAFDRGCNCLLDNGGMFDKSVCTGAGFADTSFSNTGAICNLLQVSERECWKVDDSNLQCPTPAPTNKPTTASPTNEPTTLAPTPAPTLAPTNKPTTASPTNKPTTASPMSSPKNSKSAKVAKKAKSSKVDQLGAAAAANLQVQQMKSDGSSISISHPLVGVLALIAFSNLLP